MTKLSHDLSKRKQSGQIQSRIKAQISTLQIIKDVTDLVSWEFLKNRKQDIFEMVYSNSS